MVIMAIMRMVSIMLLTSLWEQMGRGTWLLTNPTWGRRPSWPPACQPSNMGGQHVSYTPSLHKFYPKQKEEEDKHHTLGAMYILQSEKWERRKGLVSWNSTWNLSSCKVLFFAKKKLHDKLQLSCEYLDPSKSLLLVLQLSDSQMVR